MSLPSTQLVKAAMTELGKILEKNSKISVRFYSTLLVIYTSFTSNNQ